MKLQTLLTPALLAILARADTTTSSSSSSSSSSPSSASATGSSPEPTPLGALWAPKWTASSLTPYTTHCRTHNTLTASIYTLGEMYPALKDFAPELKVFYHNQHYPGSWGGEDRHGNERELLKMGLESVPFAVREWLRRNEGRQRRFSVQDDVVFFAPGAIYQVLPLWVEGGEGECEGVFDDLENYKTEPADGVVLGSVAHKKTGKNDMEITIEAFQVKKKVAEEGDAGEKEKDEL